jgi:hypothetical protein
MRSFAPRSRRSTPWRTEDGAQSQLSTRSDGTLQKAASFAEHDPTSISEPMHSPRPQVHILNTGSLQQCSRFRASLAAGRPVPGCARVSPAVPRRLRVLTQARSNALQVRQCGLVPIASEQPPLPHLSFGRGEPGADLGPPRSRSRHPLAELAARSWARSAGKQGIVALEHAGQALELGVGSFDIGSQFRIVKLGQKPAMTIVLGARHGSQP